LRFFKRKKRKTLKYSDFEFKSKNRSKTNSRREELKISKQNLREIIEIFDFNGKKERNLRS